MLAALPADPLRQRLEVLRRVEDAAGDADMGLVILVDDAQWIDASSLSVLAFVANRISESAVAMVVAARAEVAPLGFAAHPVVPLPLLDTLQSRLVLRRTGLDLDETLTAAIVTAAAGNPLALLELARTAAAGKVAVPTRCSPCRTAWSAPSPPSSPACRPRPGTCWSWWRPAPMTWPR